MAGTYDFDTDTITAKLVLPDGEAGEIKKIDRYRLSRGALITSEGVTYALDRTVWKDSGKGYLCVIHLIEVSTWETEQAEMRKVSRMQHFAWFALGLAVAAGFAWLKLG